MTCPIISAEAIRSDYTALRELHSELMGRFKQQNVCYHPALNEAQETLFSLCCSLTEPGSAIGLIDRALENIATAESYLAKQTLIRNIYIILDYRSRNGKPNT